MATKKRLIDAKQLKRDMYLLATLGDNENIFIDVIIDEIDNADEVDAVEVVRGRWEEWWPGISLIMTGEEMLYQCTACTAKYDNVEGFRYCPHCGATMGGDNNV